MTGAIASRANSSTVLRRASCSSSRLKLITQRCYLAAFGPALGCEDGADAWREGGRCEGDADVPGLRDRGRVGRSHLLHLWRQSAENHVRRRAAASDYGGSASGLRSARGPPDLLGRAAYQLSG